MDTVAYFCEPDYYDNMRIYILIVLMLLLIERGYSQWQKAQGPWGGYITAIACKNNKIFAAVGSSKTIMYFSTDSGKHWQKTPDRVFGLIKCMEIASNGRIVLGGNMGIQFSDDDGSNWIQSPLSNKNIIDLALKDSDVYAASYDAGLYKLPSDMQTFETIADNPKGLGNTTGLRSIYISNDTIALGVYTFSKYHILGSVNNGKSWDTLAHLPEVAYAITSINHRWFVKTYNALIYSDDLFQNYYKCSLPTQVTNYTSSSNNCLVRDGNNIYLSGFLGVSKSEDGGQTWKYISTTLENKSSIKIAKNDHQIFTATEGGIYATNDDGNSWSKFDQGINENTIIEFVTMDKNLLASTSFDGVHYSTDNGISWTHSTGMLQGCAFVTFSKENEVLFAMNSDGNVYSTQDAGKSWILFDSTHIYNQNYYKRSFLYTNGRLYTSDNNGRLYSADTGVKQWSLVTTGKEMYKIRKFGNSFYAAFKYDGLYRSDDNGITWTLLQQLFYIYNSGDFNIYKNKIIAVGGYVTSNYISLDSGVKWSSFLKNKAVYSTLISDADTIYATGDGKIYKSVDGANWIEEKVGNLLSEPINTIEHSNGIFSVGTNNGIYYSSRNLTNIPSYMPSTLGVFPNPTSSQISIPSHININKVDLKNTSGQNVPTILASTNTIDISSLPQGVYIIIITDTQGTIYYEKIIIGI